VITTAKMMMYKNQLKLTTKGTPFKL